MRRDKKNKGEKRGKVRDGEKRKNWTVSRHKTKSISAKKKVGRWGVGFPESGCQEHHWGLDTKPLSASEVWELSPKVSIFG